jgi:hypothetical protein
MNTRKTALAGTFVAAALMVAALLAGAGQAATKAAPVNTAVPTISGTPKVGQTLTASNGTWSNSPTAYTYQWLRCNTTGGSCVSVANGTQKTYTLVGADAGHQMRVRVTASNADGNANAESDPTATVQGSGASSGAPRATDQPIVSGTPEQGEVLTTDEGSWTGNPTSFSYQWQRCEADNIVSCAGIPGATSKTYTVSAIDVGYRLRSQVTAKNANGSGLATSATTAVIRPKVLPAANGRPTLAIISLRVLGHTVYARFRACDDSNKNLSIRQTTSRPGVASYSRSFSTVAAPRPCGVYTRHWLLVSRFRGHRVTITLVARDKSGASSAPARRTLARG